MGAELLGEYKDSGYGQPPSRVRWPDGQFIQTSALLYQVTFRIDDARDATAIAGLVSADLGRTLTADQASSVAGSAPGADARAGSAFGQVRCSSFTAVPSGSRQQRSSHRLPPWSGELASSLSFST
jgi:hypothetical protein